VLAALGVVTLIGLADSLNPSTIGPALYLATTRGRARAVVAFGAGVFAVSFLGGLALILGLGTLVLDSLPEISATAKHVLEIGGGMLVLAVGFVFWVRRRRAARPKLSTPGRGHAASFALGAGIMAVELPTAFPYFAAIAVILAATQHLAGRIVLLVVFNVLFVLPVILIAAILEFAGDRAPRELESLNAWVRGHANAVIAILALAAGVALTGAGVVGLASS